MPHIDEPLLQAYIDGFCSDARVTEIETHLASCQECAARLDAARAAATRASKLLGTLEPGPMHAPSFEELKERAAAAPADAARVMDALQKARAATAGSEPARRDRSRLKSPMLAWAATIVIAFAVGWMTRGGPGTRPELAARGPVAATAPQQSGVPAAESVRPDSAKQTIQDRDQAPADEAAAPAPGSRVAGDPAAVAEEAEAGRPAASAAVAPPERQADAAIDSTLGSAELMFANAVPDEGFVPIRAADAELWLGAPPRTLPDLALVRVEVGPATAVEEGLPQRNPVRITYQTANGEEISLLQQYVGTPRLEMFAADAASALRADRPARGADDEARTRAAESPAAPAAAAPFADALDLPATVREPDGRVIHTWMDAGYLLRLSGRLEVDAVRDLASRAR